MAGSLYKPFRAVTKRKVRELLPDYKGKPGPKPKPVDWGMVERLAKIGCMPSEIAAVVGVCEETLGSRPEFLGVYKKGAEQCKVSLRRMQWHKAKAGDTTMLIFLGKQILNQGERMQVSGPSGAAIEVEAKYSPSLKKLSDEKVFALIAILEEAGGMKEIEGGVL